MKLLKFSNTTGRSKSAKTPHEINYEGITVLVLIFSVSAACIYGEIVHILERI